MQNNLNHLLNDYLYMYLLKDKTQFQLGELRFQLGKTCVQLGDWRFQLGDYTFLKIISELFI